MILQDYKGVECVLRLDREGQDQATGKIQSLNAPGPGNRALRSEVALQESQNHMLALVCASCPVIRLCFSLKEHLTQGWLPALAQQFLVGHGLGHLGFLSSCCLECVTPLGRDKFWRLVCGVLKRTQSHTALGSGRSRDLKIGGLSKGSLMRHLPCPVPASVASRPGPCTQ